MNCWGWEAELINPGKSRQAVEDSGRHTRAGPQGRRLAHKARLVAFCAHLGNLRSQASKYEWLGMKINLELMEEKDVSSLVASQAALVQVQLGERLGRRVDRPSGLWDSPPLFPPAIFRFLRQAVPGPLEPVKGRCQSFRDGVGQEAVSPCSSSA